MVVMADDLLRANHTGNLRVRDVHGSLQERDIWYARVEVRVVLGHETGSRVGSSGAAASAVLFLLTVQARSDAAQCCCCFRQQPLVELVLQVLVALS